MPVSSTPSKRVALAPININTAASSSSGFKNRYNYNNANKAPDSLPLTPTLTPKIALVRSATAMAPDRTNSMLFSGEKARKLESFSEYKISNSKNVKADLAATKLKLRLQLALYKLRQTKKAAMAASPNIRVSKTRPNIDDKVKNVSQSPLSLKTQSRKVFVSSANVNLQKPRSMMASSKMLTENTSKFTSSRTQMKLYHIRPSSAFYNTYAHKLPLTGSHTQRLPPVHKILRTPIKAASRAMSQLGPVSNCNVTSNANSDETIDESIDDHAGNDVLKKKTDILGSSPLRYNNFGTPNSFSVAKSLLQLGSGFY